MNNIKMMRHEMSEIGGRKVKKLLNYLIELTVNWGSFSLCGRAGEKVEK